MSDLVLVIVIVVMVGVAFGASGAVYQRTLRNPLASPDIVGISVGASAAAVFGIVVLHASGAALSIAAVAGAVGTALCVRLGIRYLRALQDRFGGDLSMALMAYNAGPDRIRQAIRERALDPYRFYPRRVKRDFERFRTGAGLGGDWAYAVRDPEPAVR